VAIVVPELEPETEPVVVALIITGDHRRERVTAKPLTSAALQPPALVKPFVSSHRARAPPFIQEVSRL
jgi:hypothetical protein